MDTKKSVFETLSAVNCNEHVEKKNGLTYLSWAWAWHIVKTYYPGASYTIYEDVNGIPYFTDGRTCWVKTGVTIEGQELKEYLPIMDYKNVSIPAERVTSMDMNKAIQRSLTKACARHGLGLYIYAGEDLPEALSIQDESKPQPAPKQQANAPSVVTLAMYKAGRCKSIYKYLTEHYNADTATISDEAVKEIQARYKWEAEALDAIIKDASQEAFRNDLNNN